ncbi:hypothetical protein Tco_0216068 [Tanacetum coccineum]
MLIVEEIDGSLMCGDDCLMIKCLADWYWWMIPLEEKYQLDDKLHSSEEPWILWDRVKRKDFFMKEVSDLFPKQDAEGVENVQENIRNMIVNGNWVGCSYKEFLACNPKEYDGKGGAVVLTRWIEKMENVQDMSGCSVDVTFRI